MAAAEQAGDADPSSSRSQSGSTDHGRFEGLIFDCDGTLADTMPLHFVAWTRTMQRHGIEFGEQRFYAMAGQPTVRIIEQLLADQQLDGDAVKIAEEKEQAFLEVLPQVRPIAPVLEIARRYRPSLAMGVGSGGNRDVVLLTLDRLGLSGFFDAVVGAEDTPRHKPEPDVFLEVARRIGVRPQACQVFEDADLGVEAARRAGMACFDVRTIHRPGSVNRSDA